MKIQTNKWYTQDELWKRARDSMGIISIAEPTSSSERKKRLIPAWEKILPGEFQALREQRYDLKELAGMLNMQAEYMSKLSEHQMDELLEALGITDPKDVFPKVVEFFIEISNIPKVEILSLETARDSAYIVSSQQDKNGENYIQTYEWKTRPSTDFGKKRIEELLSSYQEAGKSVRHMIVGVLIPFTLGGIIQRKNFYKVAGVYSQIDWVFDNNVKSVVDLISDFKYKNLWSLND